MISRIHKPTIFEFIEFIFWFKFVQKELNYWLWTELIWEGEIALVSWKGFLFPIFKIKCMYVSCMSQMYLFSENAHQTTNNLPNTSKAWNITVNKYIIMLYLFLFTKS